MASEMTQIMEMKKELDDLKTKFEWLKTNLEITPCPLCEVGKRECDCDKCGVWGCYECVSGGHGKDEDLNLCPRCEEEEEDVAYKCCRDCDYTWDTKAAWDAGKGRVAFSYPAEDIEDGDVVCSLCYKGEEEYFPSDDED